MRDLRDPQKLGEALLTQTPMARDAYGQDIPITEVYDYHVGKFDIPDYSHSESTVDITVRKYRQELEERAAQGDRYAKSMLEEGEPGDEPIP